MGGYPIDIISPSESLDPCDDGGAGGCVDQQTQ
jgi:hypothetical protein